MKANVILMWKTNIQDNFCVQNKTARKDKNVN